MGNSNFKQHYETASKTGVLQITNNKIKDIPEEVLNLSENLRNLDLSKNKISRISDEISKLKNLKQLKLDCNLIQDIPNSLTNLKKLELLNVSSNKISSLPQSFSYLTNLKQVYLSNNNFTHFPTQLYGLKNLDVVEISNNKISEVPRGMANFFAAELNLSQNEISSLPDDFHQAPRLKILKLEENCLNLDAIHPSLLRDSKLHTINLEGNLFETKQLASLEGYNEYTERYTAIKKKMF
ncbi:unnamed protein product [Leptidea sinapis]|uniref:Disease resistance R13L4/SHOC-2-like LRR domain-containing protein n=1 Tax=Leptidea sinapis TaxID=189913 RepID=A0A5E4Q3K8_9NEOP|nr:unnamed protein product [Leptidea sinapis]